MCGDFANDQRGLAPGARVAVPRPAGPASSLVPGRCKAPVTVLGRGFLLSLLMVSCPPPGVAQLLDDPPQILSAEASLNESQRDHAEAVAQYTLGRAILQRGSQLEGTSGSRCFGRRCGACSEPGGSTTIWCRSWTTSSRWHSPSTTGGGHPVRDPGRRTTDGAQGTAPTCGVRAGGTGRVRPRFRPLPEARGARRPAARRARTVRNRPPVVAGRKIRGRGQGAWLSPGTPWRSGERPG